MCFKKKKTVSDKATVAERAKPFMERKQSIKELDLSKVKDIEVLRYCLDIFPTMAFELDLNDAVSLSALKVWIKGDYIHYNDRTDPYYANGNPYIHKNYPKYLDSRLNHPELLAVYLDEKLKDTLPADSEELSFITSYDKKLVLNYRYETKRGETISYFDKTLGVPTSLVVTAAVRLKLVNAQKLVEKIDVDIRYIDMTLVTNFITSALSRTVRDTVLSYIVAKDLTYYGLPQHYTALNRLVLDKLQEFLGSCGLEVNDFSISDIAVPDNTDELLKNQYFAIAEAERVKEHEQKMEKASLELYERKAEIHSKYPDFPITLTEAEKDFALNRYMTRKGHDMTLKADIKEEYIGGRKMASGGTVTEEHKSASAIIKTSNKFRFIYSSVVVSLYIIAFVMFAVSLRAGFISLGCVTLAAGITAACCYKQLKYGEKTKQVVNAEYVGEAGTNAVGQAEAIGANEGQDVSNG